MLCASVPDGTGDGEGGSRGDMVSKRYARSFGDKCLASSRKGRGCDGSSRRLRPCGGGVGIVESAVPVRIIRYGVKDMESK